MKKIIRKCLMGLVILSTCLFTSCIDYVQTISFGENGYNCYFKLAISNALLEMVDMDSDDLFEGFDEIAEDLPRGAKFTKVDNDIDSGIEFNFIIDGYTNPEDAALFYPYLSDDESEIMLPFVLGQNGEAFDSFDSDEPETNAIMVSYMATTKCRVLVSKTVVPEMYGAYFYGVTADDGYLDIPFYDYGESWCLEIPLIYFTARNNFDLSEIAIEI